MSVSSFTSLLLLMIHPNIQNVAEFENGCFIAEESRCIDNCSAYNILSSNQNKNWVTSIQEKSYCVIDLTAIKVKPEDYNCISFNSDISSNNSPSHVTLFFKQKTNELWKVLGVFQLQRYAGWQSFVFKKVKESQLKYLRVDLTKNFGGKALCLTQIALGYFIQTEEHETLKKDMSELKKENSAMQKKIDQQDLILEQMQKQIMMLKNLLNVGGMKDQILEESDDEFEKLNGTFSIEEEGQPEVEDPLLLSNQEQYQLL